MAVPALVVLANRVVDVVVVFLEGQVLAGVLGGVAHEDRLLAAAQVSRVGAVPELVGDGLEVRGVGLGEPALVQVNGLGAAPLVAGLVHLDHAANVCCGVDVGLDLASELVFGLHFVVSFC